MALPFINDGEVRYDDAQARRRGFPERGGSRHRGVQPLGSGAQALGRQRRLRSGARGRGDDRGPASAGCLAGELGGGHGSGGVHRRVLDPGVRGAGAARTEGLAGRRAAAEVRARAQERRAGLPVAAEVDEPGAAARGLASQRRGVRAARRGAPARGAAEGAGPLGAAHAKGAGADEHPAHRGADRCDGYDRAGHRARHCGRRARSCAVGPPSPAARQGQPGRDRPGAAGQLARGAPVRARAVAGDVRRHRAAPGRLRRAAGRTARGAGADPDRPGQAAPGGQQDAHGTRRAPAAGQLGGAWTSPASMAWG